MQENQILSCVACQGSFYNRTSMPYSYHVLYTLNPVGHRAIGWHLVAVSFFSTVQLLYTFLCTSTHQWADWGFSWFLSVPPCKFQGNILKLGHYYYLPNPFQFIIIHLSSCHQGQMVYLLKKCRKLNSQPMGSS
jgi:hypothetical protein